MWFLLDKQYPLTSAVLEWWHLKHLNLSTWLDRLKQVPNHFLSQMWEPLSNKAL